MRTRQIAQLAGLVLLLAVGVAFFITLFTIVTRYEETAEQYFIDYSYADITFYGAFDNESVEILSSRNEIFFAHGRTVRDFREDETIFRAVSLTLGINTPYIYEGKLPQNENETAILRRNANAMGLSVGDTLTIGENILHITGLVASPEYIYMVQNERTLMAHPDRFAVLFVTDNFFPQGYNEIVARTSGEISTADAAEISDAIGAFYFTLQKDQVNHHLYQSDLTEIRSFAYIFPVVFAVLIAVVIYVMLSRTIQKERKQIGIMKALGLCDNKIIRTYLLPFCVTALIGAVLGGIAAIFITDLIIGIFGSMFELPTLSFVFYPVVWAFAIAVSVLICAISGVIALLPILALMPAHAMRQRIPKGGRKILLEKLSMWKNFSFNTRYALKNSFRNKSRFFAVVLGMCGSCALLAFSLGFYDSMQNTTEKYFEEFANYDVIVSFDPIPHSVEHLSLAEIDFSFKAFVTPVDIRGGHELLAIVEAGFDMLNIPADALLTGVILPEYFAQQWRVSVGDYLEIEGHNAIISAITPQYLGLTLYTSFDYIFTLNEEFPAIYNTIYGRDSDVDTLTNFLKANNINFVTIDDDRTSFDSIMESMSVLLWFMIFCALVLGFTVLYSVGLINLSAREYEYMFMGVMGYPHKSILSAHAKETVLQLLLAIPLGFIVGNLLLEAIKGEFSGSSFVIAAQIFPPSYLISAACVVGVSAIMAAVTSRHIKGLDIVEGLKARDE
jgi:putative ABC transport system permease protein